MLFEFRIQSLESSSGGAVGMFPTPSPSLILFIATEVIPLFLTGVHVFHDQIDDANPILLLQVRSTALKFDSLDTELCIVLGGSVTYITASN